jgi:hypothetical protein
MCWVGSSSLRFQFVKEWFEGNRLASARQAAPARWEEATKIIFEWPYQDHYIVGALHIRGESAGDLATFVPDSYGV